MRECVPGAMVENDLFLLAARLLLLDLLVLAVNHVFALLLAERLLRKGCLCHAAAPLARTNVAVNIGITHQRLMRVPSSVYTI